MTAMDQAIEQASQRVAQAVGSSLQLAYQAGLKDGGSSAEVVARVRQLRDDIAACWDDANTTVDVVVTALDRALKGDS
jgi:hypothetical protein